jgi:hypothetical protein
MLHRCTIKCNIIDLLCCNTRCSEATSIATFIARGKDAPPLAADERRRKTGEIDPLRIEKVQRQDAFPQTGSASRNALALGVASDAGDAQLAFQGSFMLDSGQLVANKEATAGPWLP